MPSRSSATRSAAAGKWWRSPRRPPRTATAAPAHRSPSPRRAAARSTSGTACRPAWSRRGMRVAGVRGQRGGGGPLAVGGVGGLDALPRLVAESDVLVIAAPRTALTGAAVSRDVLARLPAAAIVVNVSRGDLLDETALLEGLDAGRLRGAALDVFAREPLPAGHPFWRHPRVLVSPHAAGVTGRYWERETGLIVENIHRYLAGAPLLNVVDLEAGY